ncbi:MAG: LysR family transcriptional regulator [Pseudomonadota bacterium]
MPIDPSFHIKIDMKYGRRTLPSIAALTAFENVARHGGFTRAADELNTSQSAVSRHVRQLEERLGTRLFDRSVRGVLLTREGSTYLASVSPALESLHAAGQALRRDAGDVTLACTHEVSHLILMPKHEQLRSAIGPNGQLRILTTEYETFPAMVEAGADITFGYASCARAPEEVLVLPEELAIVAAPPLKADAESGQAPLLDLSKPNHGWSTWRDFFGYAPDDIAQSFDSYVYLLEAAAAGKGAALGWRRFVDRYLEAGMLVRCGEWRPGRGALCARLTPRGARNDAAKVLLKVVAYQGS